MILDATQNYNKALTKERLFGWHAALFSTERSRMGKSRVGQWRDDSTGPMQIVSGPIGKEMQAFISRFNRKAPVGTVLKTAITNLWFVTIHPFEDGNGCIARALTDMLRARSEDSSQCFYSMSAQIQAERKSYYEILETTQKGNLDITE
jgi:Fic family protein